MKCFTCGDLHPIVHYPYDEFHSSDFGHIEDQKFALCEECNFLYTHNFLATLSHLFVKTIEKDCGHEHSKDMIYCAKIHIYFLQLQKAVQARLN